MKLSILKQFIKTHENLPNQGSDAWLTQRLDRIGGSEVATILKKNKNKTVNKLILEKLNFNPFKGNAITYWGNVFEELVRRYAEETFNCTIHETGSIPFDNGFLSYSPDGISIVSNDNLSKILDPKDYDLNTKDKEYLTLFEFKCPHTRIPSLEIPEHYIPQITIGMNIINIMEVGIFIQAVYRRCFFKQLDYSTSHNKYGHFKPAEDITNPIESGFMLLHCDDDNYALDLIEYLKGSNTIKTIDVDDGIPDIGSLYDSDVFEEILKGCVSKKIQIDYCFRNKYVDRIFSADGMTQAFYNISLQHRATMALQEATKKYSNTNIIGVLPYKLLNVFVTPVKKEPNYIEATGAYIKAQKVIQCINDHRGMACKIEVTKSVRKYKL